MTELCDLSAVEARRLIGTKEVSPVELLDACLDRIAAVNPALNAVVALDAERARAAAREAERAVLDRRPLGPLHGLPVGIKDLTETAGLRTTFGSRLFEDHVPTRDEGVVASLRAAGAIVLAKTNTPEFGTGAVTTNQVYGMTGNPFDPALTSSGSSGGSAAALAAGMVPLATGTDFGGSLRTPAGFCGIVGFRPSPGLVPQERRLRGWAPLSVDGPMGRTVADAALLLSAMAGDDRHDPLSRAVDAASFRALPAIDLATVRLGLSEDLGFARVDPRVRETFRARTAELAGVVASAEPVSPDLGDADATFAVLRGASFLSSHGERVAGSADRLGPLMIENVRYARTLSVEQVVAAEAEMTRLGRAFQDLFDSIDMLVCPVTAVPPFAKEDPYCAEIDGVAMQSYIQWVGLTYGLTLTCCPVACIPCGRDPTGMPFGIQVCGPKGSDLRVLAVAHALERWMASRPDLSRPVPDLSRLGA